MEDDFSTVNIQTSIHGRSEDWTWRINDYSPQLNFNCQKHLFKFKAANFGGQIILNGLSNQ